MPASWPSPAGIWSKTWAVATAARWLVFRFWGVNTSLPIRWCESGAGKELIAHTFHQSGPTREGSFVSVNCAAIPAGIAERLLFGARKGAFSGIEKDCEGYFAAADTGTLFLDEVGDLELSVQGKVLCVLETGELLPLGANRPRRVQLRICTATHNDLRQRVQTGAFRADLYFRIGIPEVIVPPLRSRREEIPWLMTLALEATAGGTVLRADRRCTDGKRRQSVGGGPPVGTASHPAAAAAGAAPDRRQ